MLTWFDIINSLPAGKHYVGILLLIDANSIVTVNVLWLSFLKPITCGGLKW